MNHSKLEITNEYMKSIKLHGSENVFLAMCQKFADHYGTKGIKGKKNYDKSIAAAFQFFNEYNLPVPTKTINKLLAG
jgi:hypothetical protein